ncbi:MAG TPA: glycosyltransferase family 1 protein [Candidatus Fournierella merdigallinarum]|nr:glycosyltransferase family 1 protein [Candidatus Fournierella merdigallinarum]
MAPIRVLHCVAGLGHGGYESLVMNLYRQMDRDKVQFDFVSSFPGVYEAEIEALGGVIHRIPFITQKGPFVYTAALDRVLRAGPRYPIVHSHMDKFSGLVMQRAAKAGIPVRIAHSHNTKNEGGLAFQLVKDHYGRMVLPWATDLFACSKAAARWMFGEKAGDAHILFNGVQPEHFAPRAPARARLRAAWGLGEGTLVLGHVGRFTAQKNHAFLLEVFAALHALRPDSALVLAGTGPLQEQAARAAAGLGLEQAVRFLGAREDVPDLLSAFDCFVFPSLHEGLPVTLVEAQAAGLPVVASSAITDEVCITPLVRRLGLDQPAALWAQAALNAAAPGFAARRCPADAIRAAGYDIADAARWLQDFYLKKAGEVQPWSGR